MTVRLAAACVRKLIAAAACDPKLWVLDGDLADSYAGTEFAEQWPERFVMAGIAEQNMVSMAAGMAACGLKPWVFSFAAFLAYRAADQIRVSLAQTRMPVALVGSHAGGCGGRNGKTHQCVGDLALFGALPGMHVWTPCDAADTAFATEAILRTARPSYLRAPREGCPDLPGAPGSLRWLSEPSSNIIVANGLAAHWALEVRDELARRGVAVSVLHVAQFVPIPSALAAVIAEARRWFVIEDHVRHGGLTDILAQATHQLPHAWFGWPAAWTGGSGDACGLRALCGLDATTIANSIMRAGHWDHVR